MKLVSEYIDEYNYYKDKYDKALEKFFNGNIEDEQHRQSQWNYSETCEEKMDRLKTLSKLEYGINLVQEARKTRQIFESYTKNNIRYYDEKFDKF